MKTYKPYLSLEKNSAGNYTLEAVFSCPKTQNIISIEQQPLTVGSKTYWAVYINVSSDIQLICGPEENVIYTTIEIDGSVSSQYKTVKCIVQQIQSTVSTARTTGPVVIETDIDFGDGGQ